MIPTRHVKCPVCGRHITQARTGTLQRHKAKPKWGFGGKILNETASDWCPGGGKQKVGKDAPKEDAVNHPSHYNSHPSGVECIDIVEHMTFNCGNTVKYLWRAGLKDGNPSIQDLKKARWYLDREIQRLEKDATDA